MIESNAASRHHEQPEEPTLFDVEPVHEGHHRVVCSCGRLITQCRCVGVKPTRVSPRPCTHERAGDAPSWPPRYLDVQGLADVLGVSVSTVRRNISRTDAEPWPCTRVGRLIRFSPENVTTVRTMLADGNSGSL